MEGEGQEEDEASCGSPEHTEPRGNHCKEVARCFQPEELDFRGRQEATARCPAHAGCLEESGGRETGVYTKHEMTKPGSNWEQWGQKGRNGSERHTFGFLKQKRKFGDNPYCFRVITAAHTLVHIFQSFFFFLIFCISLV